MMDCMLPICNIFLFYYFYIVFHLRFTSIIRIKIGQVRYFNKIMVKDVLRPVLSGVLYFRTPATQAIANRLKKHHLYWAATSLLGRLAFVFNLPKAIVDRISFRVSRSCFGKWNWFAKMVNAIPEGNLPLLNNSAYHFPKPWTDRLSYVNYKQPQSQNILSEISSACRLFDTCSLFLHSYNNITLKTFKQSHVANIGQWTPRLRVNRRLHI